MTMVNAKLDTLTKKMERLDMKAVGVTRRCEICGGGHVSIDCNTINTYPGEQSTKQANAINFN